MKKGLKYEKFKEKWKELYESGMSFRQIGKLENVDAKTVNRTLQGLVKIRPKSPWDKYVDEWYELYKNGYSKSDISKKHKCDIKIVTRVLEKRGVERKSGGQKRLYEHLASDFADMYNAGYSLAEIGKKHNIDKQTIRYYLNYQDVKTRELSEAIRKHQLNEHYFDEIDSEEKAYHLGLLFATGSALEQHNGYVIQVTMHQKKKHIIQPLIDVLRGEDVGGYTSKKGILAYRFNSRHLYETVRKYGMNAKSKMTFPHLEEKWNRAFLAGYMVDKSFMIKTRHHLYITGTKAFLESIKEVLSPHVDASKIHLYEVSENEHRFVVFDGDTIDDIYDWIDIL
ncbi:hypothetical protein R3O67_34010 [Bacillus cereus]|uniref:hypothetical protein n=1 Tax=Bacillus cereus TaxID=1396 RepID=UPI0030798464